MSLADCQISPDTIKEVELRSLELIKQSSLLATICPHITSRAESSYARLRSLSRIGKGTILYDYESFFDSSIEGKECRIYFGGKAVALSAKKCDAVSLYISIYDLKSKKVLRKFHFDYDSGSDIASKSSKPYYHIQYGGKLTPLMKGDGIVPETQQHIETWLSTPRILYIPMSLFSLVAIILKEVQPEAAIELFSEQNWKNHLINTEKIMLAPFYKACTDKIIKKESLLMDYFYHS
jgi:hypothetical protein